ncbi:MAG: hypothetical protein ACRDH0_09530 [Actinomycetota bacterium]
MVGFVDASLQRHEGGGTYHRTGVDVYVEELIVTYRTVAEAWVWP